MPHTPSTSLAEAADARLLPCGRLAQATLLERSLVPVVVLHGRDRCILSDMEVIVKVAAIGAVPGEIPSHALLVRRDLRDGSSRHADESGIARIDVLKAGKGVAGEGAGRAARVPVWSEHEVIDDELAPANEQVREVDGDLLAGVVECCEGVGFFHLNNWEGTPFG